MWALRIRGYDENNIYGAKAIKHKISIHYYPFSHYLEKGKYYFIAIGFIEGLEKNINEFFKELLKDTKPSKNKRYVASLEIEENFFMCITAQSEGVEAEKHARFFYNPKFIHTSPAIIRADGYEEWNITSQSKEDIEKLADIARKYYRSEIMSLKKAKLNAIEVLSVLPDLTAKQKTAFKLAVDNGYYEYPRKTELEKLAKLMHVALSTYQAHLRKTERKLLPYLYKKYF